MTCRLSITLPLSLLAAAFLLPSVWAQGHGGGGGRAASAPKTGGGVRGGKGEHGRSGHSFERQGAYDRYGYYPGWDWGYFPPPYFDLDEDYGYDYGPEEPQAAPPPVVMMQPAQPPAHPSARAAHPVASLMLERHGDQWVRVDQSAIASPSVQSRATQASSQAPAVAIPSEPEQPLLRVPPAVLVFRDGHQEEIERYSIIDGVIYTRMDYWSTGSWTRKIPLAELDIPATLKQNRDRGGLFTLPSGPHEVVIQP